jgi:outer membrane protein assembly factor BamB
MLPAHRTSNQPGEFGMNHPVRAFAALLLTAALASAQDPARRYSQPTVPSDETLQRLNLKLGWRTYIPMDGRRDSVFSIQSAGDLILVQTRSGLICVVEAETGRIRWQARVGRAYHVSVRLGFNSRSIYAVNDQTIYVLDRENGDVKWQSEMPSAVTTAPVADDNEIFLSQRGGVVTAYALPQQNPNIIAKSNEPPKKGAEKEAAPQRSGVGKYTSIGAMTSASGQGSGTLVSIGAMTSALKAARLAASHGYEPVVDWSDSSDLRIGVPPLQTATELFVVGVGGRMAAFAKGQDGGLRYNRVLADDLIIAQPGQFKETAYVASTDTNLYAVDIPTGSVTWRFTASYPISRRPAVTEDDVYITTDSGGLQRLDRVTGREIWRNGQADRFVSLNSKTVYATDRAGRLLLLDRIRGSQAGVLDVRDFVLPIINDFTDRVYLGSNDGLLVCLHDRDLPKPRLSKQIEVPKPDVKKRGDRVREKPAEKPVEKPKPKPKDEDEAPAEEPKPKPKAGDKAPAGDKKGDAMDKKP